MIKELEDVKVGINSVIELLKNGMFTKEDAIKVLERISEKL